jgi:branched-chain amino acid aminotransferase
MSECFGNSFILNGELLPIELFDNQLIYEGDSIYEVLRMVKGHPVFFTDHLERLNASALLQRKRMLADSDKLKTDIIALSRSEKRREVNLKIVFNYNKSENYLIYNIEPAYPSPIQYKNGVKGSLFFGERKDPESKVIDHKLRSEIYHKLLIEGSYEALLVNKYNCVTEGSRSNIFFIKDQSLTTAPAEAVLSGITRKHVIEICGETGIEVKYGCIKADRLSEYDSVVMTGTSPVVLPFSSIDKTRFKVSHPFISLIRKIYLARMEESIHQFES